jgi:hypothetical protein
VSDAPDPLEAELAALRPRAVSPDLRRRVADRLSARPHRRWGWGFALVGGLTTVVLLLVPQGRKDPPPPAPPEVVPAPPAGIESPDPAPSVLAYQQALARSPEELTALLDRHAAAAPVPVPAFTRSNTTLNALIGDD